jgi:hypothetical protein
MDRKVFSDLLFVGLSNVAATHQSPPNPTDAKGYRVASPLAAAPASSSPFSRCYDDEDLIAEGEEQGAAGGVAEADCAGRGIKHLASA